MRPCKRRRFEALTGALAHQIAPLPPNNLESAFQRMKRDQPVSIGEVKYKPDEPPDGVQVVRDGPALDDNGAIDRVDAAWKNNPGSSASCMIGSGLLGTQDESVLDGCDSALFIMNLLGDDARWRHDGVQSTKVGTGLIKVLADVNPILLRIHKFVHDLFFARMFLQGVVVVVILGDGLKFRDGELPAILFVGEDPYAGNVQSDASRSTVNELVDDGKSWITC